MAASPAWDAIYAGNMILSVGITITSLFLIYRTLSKKSTKKFNPVTSAPVKFADMAGMDEAKKIIRLMDFLKTPESAQKHRAKIPRGAIVTGRPETGKSLLAMAACRSTPLVFRSHGGLRSSSSKHTVHLHRWNRRHELAHAKLGPRGDRRLQRYRSGCSL